MTSLHTHTVWSDGTATLEAMLAGAVDAHLGELGISDHYVHCPGGENLCWAMPCAFLDEYVARVLAAVATAPVRLRLGIEADYFPETIAAVRARLACLPFDYCIGSVHFAGDFPIDVDAEHWEAISPAQRDDVWRLYWQRVREMAESRVFDIAGHLDLPKKFGHRATVDFTPEIAAALDAIAAAGMSLELNTAGWRRPIGEAYPSREVLAMACAREIPLVITTDAHAPGEVAGNFDEARTLARAVGYRVQVGYAQRQAFTIPL